MPSGIGAGGLLPGPAATPSPTERSHCCQTHGFSQQRGLGPAPRPPQGMGPRAPGPGQLLGASADPGGCIRRPSGNSSAAE